MSSYDSNRSGYLHSQYQQQAPPYPTTPAPTSQPQQQQQFYPPPQQQPLYSSSPTSQPYYSSSLTSQPGAMTMIPPGPRKRRSSSSASSSNNNNPARTSGQLQPIPIPIRQPNPSDYTRTPPSSWPGPQPPVYAQPMPVYARSASHQSHHSHHSTHMHDPHAYGDGEDKFENQYGPIDEETEREYERRYAREKKAQRELESRPTLGGSLMSMMGKLGRTFGSERR
ncbi:Nn.00g106430.m01.CDS01 [Neocucurbitaria sp. VM-36]